MKIFQIISFCLLMCVTASGSENRRVTVWNQPTIQKLINDYKFSEFMRLPISETIKTVRYPQSDTIKSKSILRCYHVKDGLLSIWTRESWVNDRKFENEIVVAAIIDIDAVRNTRHGRIILLSDPMIVFLEIHGISINKKSLSITVKWTKESEYFAGHTKPVNKVNDSYYLPGKGHVVLTYSNNRVEKCCIISLGQTLSLLEK